MANGTPGINPNAVTGAADFNFGQGRSNLRKRQTISELLKEQAQEQAYGGVTARGRQVPVQWSQIAAGLLTHGVSAYNKKKADEQEEILNTEQQRVGRELTTDFTENTYDEKLALIMRGMEAGGAAGEMAKLQYSSLQATEMQRMKDEAAAAEAKLEAEDDELKKTPEYRRWKELVATGWDSDQAQLHVYGFIKLGTDSEGQTIILNTADATARMGAEFAQSAVAKLNPGDSGAVQENPEAVGGLAAENVQEAEFKIKPPAALTQLAPQFGENVDPVHYSLWEPGGIYGPPVISPGQLGGQTQQVGPKATQRFNKDRTALVKDLQANQVISLVGAVTKMKATIGQYITPGMSAEDVDLPGFGALVGTMFPGWAISQEGRNLRADAARVRNLVLKERSGMAVTDNELQRLREELQQTAFETEEGLMRGLEIMDEYTERLARLYQSNPLLGIVAPEVASFRASKIMNQALQAGGKGAGPPTEKSERTDLDAIFGFGGQ